MTRRRWMALLGASLMWSAFSTFIFSTNPWSWIACGLVGLLIGFVVADVTREKNER